MERGKLWASEVVRAMLLYGFFLLKYTKSNDVIRNPIHDYPKAQSNLNQRVLSANHQNRASRRNVSAAVKIPTHLDGYQIIYTL